MVRLESTVFMQSVGSALYDLQQAGHFCDLYLQCAEEKDVVLHTCVAAAASPFIKSVLESVGAEGQKSTMGFAIPVPAVQSEILELIAQFIYTGCVDVSDKCLLEVLNTADYFEIDVLRELCKQQIKEDMSEARHKAADEGSSSLKRKLADWDSVEAEPFGNGSVSVKRRRDGENEEEMDAAVDDDSCNENNQVDTKDDQPLDNVELSEITRIKKEDGESQNLSDDELSGKEDESEPVLHMEITQELSEVTENNTGSQNSPVRFSNRIRGKERSKILELIKKKPEFSKKQKKIKKGSRGQEQEERVVSEEEETRLFDGTHYACHLCDHICSRKIVWILHLHQEHHVQVESVTKGILSDITWGSTEDEPAEFDMQTYIAKVESEDAAETGPDLTEEDKEALIKFTKSQFAGIKPTKKQRVDKECPVCHKWFRYDTAYDDHVKKHSDPKPYKCTLCPNQYATKRSYLEHLETHENGKLFKCKECSKSFLTQSRLRSHMDYAHSSGDLGCSECDKTFGSEVALKNHVKTVHEAATFTCDVCGKTMLSGRKKEHMNLHTGAEIFTCTQCEAFYKQRSSLDHHYKTKHGESARDVHQCDECEQTFSTKQSLTKHLLRHTGNKRFTCSTCGQQFYTKGELDQHEGYHTDPKNRPWICNICRKCFTREYTLKSHMLVHSTDKPFTCEFCDKKFRWKNKLKEHMRIHTGEKPFQCRLCEERFPDCALRRHHEKKYHSEEIARNPSLIPKSATRSGGSELDGIERALTYSNYPENDKGSLHIQDLSAVEVNPQNVFSLGDGFITIANDTPDSLLDSVKREQAKTTEQFIMLDNKGTLSGDTVQVATIQNTGPNATFSNFVVVQNPGSLYVTQTLDETNVKEGAAPNYVEFIHEGENVQIMTESDLT